MTGDSGSDRPGADYRPARESAELAGVRAGYGHFLDGEFTDPADHRRHRVVDPATGAPLTETAVGAAADVDRAVAAARTALRHGWGQLSGTERAKHLYRLGHLIADRARELAALTALDTGRPVRRAGEVDLPRAEAVVLHFAGWADKVRYALPATSRPSRPAGVAGLLPPAPLPALLRQTAPALAAGCPVVLLPPADAPLLALRFGELCQQAGLPPGTVNVVTGDDSTVAALAGHADVDVLAVTGPAAAVRRTARAAAGTRSRLVPTVTGPGLHLLGDEVPVEQAVTALADAVADHAGGRLLLPEPLHDRVVAQLRDRLGRLRVDHPTERDTELGPLPTAADRDRLIAEVDAAVADGADRWSDSRPTPAAGLWFPPTLLTGVFPGHRATGAELAGPVLAVMTFRTPDEAVALAGDPPATGPVTVWGDAGARAWGLAGRLGAAAVALDSGAGPATGPGDLRGPVGTGTGLAAYLAD